jgi:UDP-N-acetylglucosamine 2-epimerase (non-hydrolysing)
MRPTQACHRNAGSLDPTGPLVVVIEFRLPPSRKNQDTGDLLCYLDQAEAVIRNPLWNAQLRDLSPMPISICHVVGARPNFMKAAPVIRALAGYPSVRQILVHTGQHYDLNMSDIFFRQLAMPAPDFNLQAGSGTHAQQTAAIIRDFEPVVADTKPSLVMVYGDVNSTIAAALVCAKLGIPVAHVEAGLRSFDRSMPEEINRVLTDQISDLLFTPSADGDRNLAREGVAADRIHLVGNVMIDTLIRMLPHAQLPEADLPPSFVLVTLHRPSNVDDLPWLQQMLETLAELSDHTPVLFPMHPRTAKALEETRSRSRDAARCVSAASPRTSSVGQFGRLRLMAPQPYLQFLALLQKAALVITDSGGIQEETTFLGVPCLTVRENTERPVTVECGTNVLVGRDLDLLREAAHRVLRGEKKAGRIPPLWDGHAADRIAEIVANRE